MNDSDSRLQAKRAQRGKFLNALYDESDGDRMAYLRMNDVGGKIGMSHQDTDQVVRYLVDEGLAKYVALGGIIAITHEGVLEVEEGRNSPSRPTHHFPPLNVINVGTMIGSNIMQNSTAGNIQIGADQLAAISQFLSELEYKTSALALQGDALAELRAGIEAVQAQLALTKPKAGIVSEGLKSIRTVLEGAAGSMVATPLLTHLVQLIAYFQ